MNGNMGIIIAVAKLSSSHPALLAWTSALLHAALNVAFPVGRLERVTVEEGDMQRTGAAGAALAGPTCVT